MALPSCSSGMICCQPAVCDIGSEHFLHHKQQEKCCKLWFFPQHLLVFTLFVYIYTHRKNVTRTRVYIFIYIYVYRYAKSKVSGPGYTSYRSSTCSFSNPGGCQVEEVDVEVDEDPKKPEKSSADGLSCQPSWSI